MATGRKESTTNSMFNFLRERADQANKEVWNPSVDVQESDQLFIIDLNVGIIKKKDVHVELEGDLITVSASRSSISLSGQKTETFSKTFRIPKCVDLLDPKAILHKQTLRIQMKKNDPDCIGCCREIQISG